MPIQASRQEVLLAKPDKKAILKIKFEISSPRYQFEDPIEQFTLEVLDKQGVKVLQREKGVAVTDFDPGQILITEKALEKLLNIKPVLKLPSLKTHNPFKLVFKDGLIRWLVYGYHFCVAVNETAVHINSGEMIKEFKVVISRKKAEI